MDCVYLSVCFSLSLPSSSSSKTGHSEVEDSGSSTSEPGAPESDRHVYKSVLEGGDIPLQGLRALNKRHGSSSSSKGIKPGSSRMWPVKTGRCVSVYGWGSYTLELLKPFPAEKRTNELYTLVLDHSKSHTGIHVFLITFLLASSHFLCSQTSQHWPITSQH